MSDPAKKYTCIIVDDRELDRLVLQSYLDDYPFVQVEGSFGSALHALDFLKDKPSPDILFLDIDMPGMNGLSLRSRLDQTPACVFITNHPEFALEGFEMAALDYLVKPLRTDRVKKMMQRLKTSLEIQDKADLFDYTLSENTLVIKDGYNQVRLHVQEIMYLEALKDYTGIVTRNKKYCVLTPLGGLLKEKSFQNFVRIHRSYAIPRTSVTEYSRKGVKVNDILLPVGRTYKDTIERLFTD